MEAVMNLLCNDELYESVSHTTDAAPYSLHYTEVVQGRECALYLHWHREMEFFYLTCGKVTFYVENKSFSLKAGEGIFIPPGLLHSATAVGTRQVCFRAFVFSPDFVLSPFETKAYNTYLLPVLRNNLVYATALQKEIDWQRTILDYLSQIFASPASDELYFRGLVLQIWHFLFCGHISHIPQPLLLETLSVRLSPALTYLHSHYHESLNLRDLAAIIPLSEGEFCRAFKRLTGISPFRYLVRYRILQSCTMLKQTDQKITEIALLVGFNNISYYNRAFKKIMGMTPTQYRQNLPARKEEEQEDL